MPFAQIVSASSALAQRQAYSGGLPLSSVERLREVLVDDAGVLQVEQHAEKSRGAKRLQGTVNGELALSCQRCDARIAWPLQIDIDLRLVETEEEEQAVLHEADPYLVQDDRLPLREIVEDEILLALPMLPRCESSENVVQASPPPQAEDETVRREVNPLDRKSKRLNSSH